MLNLDACRPIRTLSVDVLALNRCAMRHFGMIPQEIPGQTRSRALGSARNATPARHRPSTAKRKPMIDELKRCFLFADIQEAQLRRVEQNATRRRLKVGESLFQQGESATRFYLLIEGQIKLFRVSAEGNEKVVDIVTPGHTFGEALMFRAHPHYPVAAQALQPSVLISIDALDFIDMLQDSVALCFVLMDAMSRRLHGMVHEIEELSLYTASCRVAGYLLQQVQSETDQFELPVAKQVLASRLSTKPETLSRIIRQFTDEGIIEQQGRLIRVLDVDRLRRVGNCCQLQD